MKQLGILDTAFVNMEHKDVPQHIGSFGIYDQSTAPEGKVRFKSLINHFQSQLKQIPMFRTRLIQTPGRFSRPYWLVDDDVDVEFHLRHIALPKPGDWRQLCILIARLHSRPLDMSRPLWESYVIEGLDNIDGLPKGCFVIYTKIHHSIVDGGGADNFMAAIHDLEPMVHDHENDESEKYEGELKPSRTELIRSSTQSYMGNLWNLSKGSYGLFSDIGKSAVKLAKGELKAPPTNAPTTRFNEPVGPYRVIESSVFELDDLKAVKSKTGTKINDVALAIIGGGLRKYLDAHNEHPDTSLVASVPMNMRTRSGDNGDANQVGAIFSSLHSDCDDSIERLLRIHQSTQDAKEFGEQAPLKDVLKLVGTLSPRLTKRLVDLYVDNKLTKHLPIKINTVISNVPGPNFPLYCSGAKLIQYHGLGVLTPGVGIFHLVFSYSGKISITVLSDRDMMPDPGFYRSCLDDAFVELKNSVAKVSEAEIAEYYQRLYPKPIEEEVSVETDSQAQIEHKAEPAKTDEAKEPAKKTVRKRASKSSGQKNSAVDVANPSSRKRVSSKKATITQSVENSKEAAPVSTVKKVATRRSTKSSTVKSRAKTQTTTKLATKAEPKAREEIKTTASQKAQAIEEVEA